MSSDLIIFYSGVAVERAVARPLPAQIPACGFLARALQTASLPQTFICFVLAIPQSEVGLGYPALRVRPRFPLWASAACQPLPHTCTVPQVLCVIGPTVSEYYGLIRLPGSLRLFCLFASCQDPAGALKFSTLLSTHPTLFVDPGRPSEHSLFYALSVLASDPLTSLPSASGTFRPLAP